MTTNELSYNLAGHVRHLGLPVSGVHVSIYTAADGFEATANAVRTKLVGRHLTGSRGEFTFAVMPAIYRLVVTAAPGTRFVNHYSEDLTVDANTTCSVSLLTGYVLTGHVLDSNSSPVSGGSVVALAVDGRYYRGVSAIKEGAFSLVLPKGQFQVAYVSTFAEEMKELEPNLFNNVVNFRELDEPATSDLLSTAHFLLDVERDMEFDICLPELVEFVAELNDSSVKPVRNAFVALTPVSDTETALFSDLRLGATMRTDGSGRARLLVQPGNYELTVEADRSTTYFGIRQSRLEINKPTTKTFQLSQGYRLRGQVHFKEQPQRGVTVRILQDAPLEEIVVFTNSKGEFSSVLLGGQYKVIVLPFKADLPLPGLSQPAPWSKKVVVGGDTQVSVRLEEGTILEGKVLDEFGQPRVGVRVSVFEEKDHAFTNGDVKSALNGDITDDAGKYKFVVVPGSYKLVVHNDFENAHAVLVDKEPIREDLTWKGWCHLQFEVYGEDGASIGRCRLRCQPYKRDKESETAPEIDSRDFPRDSLITGADGICRITLPVGLYTLEFIPPKDSNYSEKLIRQLSVSTDVSRKVTLPLLREEKFEPAETKSAAP